MKFKKAAIKAIKSYLPPTILTNEDLAREFPDWDVEKTFQNTGVAVRHIAGPDECTSDLGVKAAQELFASGACSPAEIDFLLFCTQSPDYFLPASACLIQDRLDIPQTCGAFDFNLGCSGYVYGLALAKSLIETDLATNVLLIAGDTSTKGINPKDKGVRSLFSDGASATLITSFESEGELIGPFIFGTDGKGAKNLIIPVGGWRCRPTPESAIAHDDGTGNIRSAQDLFMDGAEIFNFSLQTVPKSIKQLLEKCQVTIEEIDFFVFHQANKFMLEALRRKIKIPKEKFSLNLENYGNTSSATIPMALEVAIDEGKINNGSKVVICGFGVGYSWAAALIKIVGDGGSNG
jgi:3-oxoacyl-[acyl-carrier-protein] synthase III